ncbi:unnamed protein product [Paramecium sonneborni]|uniref:Uncharacterized protein n=1 Tax=Paramecium sonneborni TaxID=65129 RepID=A0A8S1KH41_9CILI|nr:unnamed protein product [Paramecium sonneborni]
MQNKNGPPSRLKKESLSQSTKLLTTSTVKKQQATQVQKVNELHQKKIGNTDPIIDKITDSAQITKVTRTTTKSITSKIDDGKLKQLQIIKQDPIINKNQKKQSLKPGKLQDKQKLEQQKEIEQSQSIEGEEIIHVQNLSIQNQFDKAEENTCSNLDQEMILDSYNQQKIDINNQQGILNKELFENKNQLNQLQIENANNSINPHPNSEYLFLVKDNANQNDYSKSYLQENLIGYDKNFNQNTNQDLQKEKQQEEANDLILQNKDEIKIDEKKDNTKLIINDQQAQQIQQFQIIQNQNQEKDQNKKIEQQQQEVQQEDNYVKKQIQIINEEENKNQTFNVKQCFSEQLKDQILGTNESGDQGQQQIGSQNKNIFENTNNQQTYQEELQQNVIKQVDIKKKNEKIEVEQLNEKNADNFDQNDKLTKENQEKNEKIDQDKLYQITQNNNLSQQNQKQKQANQEKQEQTYLQNSEQKFINQINESNYGIQKDDDQYFEQKQVLEVNEGDQEQVNLSQVKKNQNKIQNDNFYQDQEQIEVYQKYQENKDLLSKDIEILNFIRGNQYQILTDDFKNNSVSTYDKILTSEFNQEQPNQQFLKVQRISDQQSNNNNLQIEQIQSINLEQTVLQNQQENQNLQLDTVDYEKNQIIRVIQPIIENQKNIQKENDQLYKIDKIYQVIIQPDQDDNSTKVKIQEQNQQQTLLKYENPICLGGDFQETGKDKQNTTIINFNFNNQDNNEKINEQEDSQSEKSSNRLKNYNDTEDQNQTQDMIDQSQYFQDDKIDLLYLNQNYINDQQNEHNLEQEEQKSEKNQKIQISIQIHQDENQIETKQQNNLQSINIQDKQQKKKTNFFCKCCQLI